MQSTRGPSLFVFELVPLPGVPPGVIEERLRAIPGAFALTARPRLSPVLFSHRFLRRGGGRAHAWHIELTGSDVPDEEAASSEVSLFDAICAEARARLAAIADIAISADYEDLSPLPDDGLVERSPGIVSFSDGEPARWEDLAGGDLPGDVAAAIEQSRAAIPVEPGLRPYGKGHVYFGTSDKAHLAYLRQSLADLAARANTSDQRKIRAFVAFQGREGSTAAINTYDNQIVTWGTGWGGLGAMGKVVERAVLSSAVRELFSRCGVRYRGQNTYDVVDLASKRVVTGKQEALEVMRASLPLLHMLIQASRDPATRDAVTDAQLQTFMAGSANISSSDQIATQALFNLIAHLKHWAPGYVVGCLEWALPQAGDGPPTEARDRRLAPLIGRYFYGKARTTRWIPDWKQFQGYWQHMKEDGLDCLDDPFIKASGPPTDDPFATTPASAAPAAQQKVLKNPPLAGVAELEAVAGGTRVLKRGAKGNGVEALQKALVSLGFDVRGGADGDFGGGTEAAVSAFQSKNDLGADGIVGRATLLALDAALGAQAQKGS